MKDLCVNCLCIRILELSQLNILKKMLKDVKMGQNVYHMGGGGGGWGGGRGGMIRSSGPSLDPPPGVSYHFISSAISWSCDPGACYAP